MNELYRNNSKTAAIARRWIELYNDGTPTFYGSDRFLELYAEDCVWIEYPSKLFPAGKSGGLAQLREALTFTQSVMVDRHVVLHELFANDSAFSMRCTWSATVNGDLLDYPKGSRISLEVGAFYKVKHGHIIEAREFLANLPELETSALRASDDGTVVQQLAGGMMLE